MRKGGFIYFGSGSRGATIHHGGKAWRQDDEAGDVLIHSQEAEGEREMNAGASFYSVLDPRSWDGAAHIQGWFSHLS